MSDSGDSGDSHDGFFFFYLRPANKFPVARSFPRLSHIIADLETWSGKSVCVRARLCIRATNRDVGFYCEQSVAEDKGARGGKCEKFRDVKARPRDARSRKKQWQSRVPFSWGARKLESVYIPWGETKILAARNKIVRACSSVGLALIIPDFRRVLSKRP